MQKPIYDMSHPWRAAGSSERPRPEESRNPGERVSNPPNPGRRRAERTHPLQRIPENLGEKI